MVMTGSITAHAVATLPFDARLAVLNEPAFQQALDERGYAIIPELLAPAECAALIALYADAAKFRSHIVMERHGFGRGEYQYFSYPLPGIVAALRDAAYPPLAETANRWVRAFGQTSAYPENA